MARRCSFQGTYERLKEFLILNFNHLLSPHSYLASLSLRVLLMEKRLKVVEIKNQGNN